MNLAYPPRTRERTRTRFIDKRTYVDTPPIIWEVIQVAESLINLFLHPLTLCLPLPIVGKTVVKNCELYGFKVTRIVSQWGKRWATLQHELHGKVTAIYDVEGITYRQLNLSLVGDVR